MKGWKQGGLDSAQYLEVWGKGSSHGDSAPKRGLQPRERASVAHQAEKKLSWHSWSYSGYSQVPELTVYASGNTGSSCCCPIVWLKGCPVAARWPCSQKLQVSDLDWKTCRTVSWRWYSEDSRSTWHRFVCFLKERNPEEENQPSLFLYGFCFSSCL